MEPKEMVARGYDTIAERYSQWSSEGPAGVRQQSVAFLVEQLPGGAAVLELGCGSGKPTAQMLASSFQVTGVDLSARQIELARQNVPNATFLQADMTALAFPPASFDAVAAFYSIIHVPRDEQPGLFRSIAGWLKPGGLFIATLGTADVAEDVILDWMGAPMYWSHFDSPTNQRLVEEAGLRIVTAREQTSPVDNVPFLWMVAQKPEA
jgi:ubiquinone/menaquinone biosynthesis C-methylase UbiE